MKALSKNADLSKIYTNHCIRASVVSKLDENGFESRHIMVVTSHKSENSIKSYAAKCPDNKKKQMFQCLSKELVPKSAYQAPVANNVAVNIMPPPQPLAPPPVQAPLQKQDPPNLHNVDVFPVDDHDPLDDENLLQILEKVEAENQDLQVMPVNNNVPPQPQVEIPNAVANLANVTNNNNIVQNVQNPNNPIPYMFFPNSTVTINYNFTK